LVGTFLLIVGSSDRVSQIQFHLAANAGLGTARGTAGDLLVNKKTANVLGLKISESLLLRADEVIE
jgi:hypothetical protein